MTTKADILKTISENNLKMGELFSRVEILERENRRYDCSEIRRMQQLFSRVENLERENRRLLSTFNKIYGYVASIKEDFENEKED